MSAQIMGSKRMELPNDVVASIREALLIGLAYYGQYVELNNACEVAESCGKPWPQEARPVDVIGNSDTVTKFAEAMQLLDVYACDAREVDHA